MASAAAAARSRNNKLRIGPLLPVDILLKIEREPWKFWSAGVLLPLLRWNGHRKGEREAGFKPHTTGRVGANSYTVKAAARPPHSKKVMGRSCRGFPACPSENSLSF